MHFTLKSVLVILLANSTITQIQKLWILYTYSPIFPLSCAAVQLLRSLCAVATML